jgi:Domain of unknown function (DUF4112)
MNNGIYTSIYIIDILAEIAVGKATKSLEAWCDHAINCLMEEKVREIEMEVLSPASDRGDEFARLLAYILDDLFPIPGTKYRVGLDPIIGLIPGLGDTSTAAFSSLILVHGLRAGVPRVMLVRMAINILINSLLGSLPGVGDLFSAWFKSNQRNYRLLRRHSAGARASTTGDWVFLIVLLVIVLAAVVTIAFAIGYMVYQMASILFGWS